MQNQILVCWKPKQLECDWFLVGFFSFSVNQKPFVTCTRVTGLGELHSFLSQSELSNLLCTLLSIILYVRHNVTKQHTIWITSSVSLSSSWAKHTAGESSLLSWKLTITSIQTKVIQIYCWFSLQRGKKVMSDSPGLGDFAIGLVNFVLNLPDRQELFFFWEIQITEGL